MKRTRIIWGASCAAVVIALAIAVCVQWHKQGCEWWPSILLGIAYYSACGAAVWAVIDAAIKGE